MNYGIISVKSLFLRIFDKLNYYWGRKLFNNFNTLSYNLFNLFYKRNICNHKYITDKSISTYHNFGFSKLGKVNANDISNLLDVLKKNNPTITPGNLYSYNYKIDKQALDVIKKIINENLEYQLKILEKYYNLKIVLVNIMITRNFHDPGENIKENYSNFFHSDGYLYNLFKVFINLEDIDKSKGPLTVVKKEKVNEFINLYSYNKRKYCNIKKRDKDLFYYNTGDKGEIFLCNTTELLHKAGHIENNKSRDILFLEFVAYPFEKNINIYSFENSLHQNLDKKYSKIIGIKNLINLYSMCKKYKINNYGLK
jgi:hypothetical protein